MLSWGDRHGVRLASPVTQKQEWFWQVRFNWSSLSPSGKRSSRTRAWTIASFFFFVNGNSDPDFDSCPALLVVFVYAEWKCAQTMLQSARAGRTWKLDTFPTRLRIWQFFVPCPGVA